MEERRMKRFLLLIFLAFVSIVTQAITVDPAMNVSGQGSDYIFVYRGNNPNQFDTLVSQGLSNLVGWTATCNTCSATSLMIYNATQPDSDYLYLYTMDSSGNIALPDSGASYGFSSPPPAVTGSSSTNSSDFSQTVVKDFTVSNNTVSSYDSIVYGSSTTVTTTTNYSDGTSAVTSSSDYTVWKAYEIPAWSYTVPNTAGNSVYLDQRGPNPIVNIEQVGDRNTVAGINNPNAVLAGNNNILIIRQAGEDNSVLAKVSGNNNVIQIPQGYHHNWATGAESPATGSSGNTVVIDVFGDNNNMFIPQEGLNNLITNKIVGSNNTNTLVQYGNDNKSYNLINGNGNYIGSWQQGNGNLSTISTVGNSNSAQITQLGNMNSSTMTLTNAGGPNNAQVTQVNNSNLSGNNFMLNQTCYLAAGCSATVTQGR
jgi:hypothetical protein